MKKILTPLLILTLFLTTGCVQRIADLTVASTKNINLNNHSFTQGAKVTGEDSRPVLIFPLGNPSIEDAMDNAIEQDKCAVGLTDVSAKTEFFVFIFGYVKYNIEGDLLIDKSKAGCENWGQK